MKKPFKEWKYAKTFMSMLKKVKKTPDLTADDSWALYVIEKEILGLTDPKIIEGDEIQKIQVFLWEMWNNASEEDRGLIEGASTLVSQFIFMPRKTDTIMTFDEFLREYFETVESRSKFQERTGISSVEITQYLTKRFNPTLSKVFDFFSSMGYQVRIESNKFSKILSPPNFKSNE